MPCSLSLWGYFIFMTEIKFICEESKNEFLEILCDNEFVSLYITKNYNKNTEECLGVNLSINDAKLLIKLIELQIKEIEGGSYE